MNRARWSLAVVVAAWMSPSLAAQDTVRFTPTVGYPTFAVREPVLRIHAQRRAALSAVRLRCLRRSCWVQDCPGRIFSVDG